MRTVLFLIALAVPSLSVAQESSTPLDRLIEFAIDGNHADQAFTFNPSAYQNPRADLPIGVFDSGIGGLTVLEAILQLDAFNNQTLQPQADGKPDFENETFVYLGDQANMPYGNYSAVGKTNYLRELILKDAIFLLGKRYWKETTSPRPLFDKPPVKAIVIACNTATAYGLEDIKYAISRWQIPVKVIGVVDAGARGVLKATQSQAPNQANEAIAVLATVGTCNSEAYPKAIRTTLGVAGKVPPAIVQQGSVDLAAAIEGETQTVARGSVEDFIEQDVLALVEQHRQSGNPAPIGKVVLGCTHFPLVQSKILQAFAQLRSKVIDGQRPYKDWVSESVLVINPAELAARELFIAVVQDRLRSSVSNRPAEARVQFFCSVPNAKLQDVVTNAEGGLDSGYKYSRSEGNFEREDTLVVPMTPDILPETSIQLMKSSLPLVSQQFNSAQ